MESKLSLCPNCDNEKLSLKLLAKKQIHLKCDNCTYDKTQRYWGGINWTFLGAMYSFAGVIVGVIGVLVAIHFGLPELIARSYEPALHTASDSYIGADNSDFTPFTMMFNTGISNAVFILYGDERLDGASIFIPGEENWENLLRWPFPTLPELTEPEGLVSAGWFLGDIEVTSFEQIRELMGDETSVAISARWESCGSFRNTN